MIDKIACFVVSYFPKRLIILLSRLEFGVSIFLYKMAKKALSEGEIDIFKELMAHSEQDLWHGKALNALINKGSHAKIDGDNIIIEEWNVLENGQKEKIYQDKTGSILPLKTFKNKETYNPDKINAQSIIRESKTADGKINGVKLEPLPFSRKFFSAKYLLEGRAAIDLEWHEIFAIMHILEKETEKLYLSLSKCGKFNNNFRQVFSRIAKDEVDHAAYPLKQLENTIPSPTERESIIKRYENRLTVSYLLVLVDLLKIFIGVV